MTKKDDYFNTFCEVSKAFGTTRRKEELLSLIVGSAIEAIEGKAACLFLADEEKDVFVPVAQKGLSENYHHASPIKAKKLMTAIMQDGYVAFKDTLTDPRLEHHETKKAEGIASILTVPVIVRDKAIGVLSLYTSKKRTFGKDEVAFLKALAEQGGMAIENARLFERIRKNSMLFLELASNLNSSLEIRNILHIMTANVADALGMKGVSIRLLNKDTGTLNLVASYGLSEAFLDKGPISAARSAVQAMKGETVIIEDATTDDRIQYREHMKKEGIASMLIVPIKVKEEVIGVMRLYSAVERQFPEDMIILVNALAHQGGLAIQNAGTLLKLEADKKSLEEDIWSHRSWF